MAIARILDAPTPWERFGAFFRTVIMVRCRPVPLVPDVRDIEELVKPLLQKELLLARIDENAQRKHGAERERELVRELSKMEVDILTMLKGEKF